MKARHQFLKRNTEYAKNVPELAKYNQVIMTSNAIVFLFLTTAGFKLTKSNFARSKYFNFGLLSFIPLLAYIGNVSDEQSKVAETALQEFLKTQFNQKL